MKIVFISDTHGLHHQLKLPKGDMIIHAGDLTKRGKKEEVLDFLEWYRELDFKYKIFIAGNHDFYFENTDTTEINAVIGDSIIYLNDTGVEIEGIHIWGSPVQPWFYDWAFNRKRGAQIKQHWDLIPSKTDILITHGPPYACLDKTVSGDLVGCEDLLETIEQTSIKIHAFGHIHESYGAIHKKSVHYINASVVNFNYKVVNEPIVVDYKNKV